MCDESTARIVSENTSTPMASIPGAQNALSRLTSLSEATPASETATLGDMEAATHHQRNTFSALLTSFARALWFGRIHQPSDQMRLGLGSDSETPSNASDTASSLFDYGHVALGLTTLGIDCSCLPHFRTPTARDWKGMSAKSWRTRTKGDTTPTLPDQIGGTPHPEFVEALMGFPIGWTALERSETPSCLKLRNGSSVKSRRTKKA